MTDTFEDPTFDPIVDDGQVEVGEETTAEEFSPEYIDFESFGDKYVKVQVDGEELEIPLKEAVSGYQRQADYTRKTQQLAEERRSVEFAKAIQQALDNDPAATVELLRTHYGLDAQQDSLEEDDLFADPMEKQFRQLESRIRSFEEQQAMTELERTISSLQSKYGEDFDANEVVSNALALGTTDLEAVYKQIAFDRLYSREQAARELNARKQAQDEKIIQAKRTGAVVAGGSSAQGAAAEQGPINSLRDAFTVAKQQLGIS